jgi:hypothetical protein
MTVVSLKGLAAHASLTEADYRKVFAKMKGWATPTAAPGHRVAVEVKSVSRLPSALGQYKVLFTVNPSDKGYLHPAMSCAIRLLVLNKPKAITVPSKALRANAKGELVVRLKTKKGESQRVVKTGNSHGGKTEIIKGLSEGDEILLP